MVRLPGRRSAGHLMGLAWSADLTFPFNNAEASEARGLLWEHNDLRVKPNLLQLRSLSLSLSPLSRQTAFIHSLPPLLRPMPSCRDNSAKELSTGRCSAGPPTESHTQSPSGSTQALTLWAQALSAPPKNVVNDRNAGCHRESR